MRVLYAIILLLIFINAPANGNQSAAAIAGHFHMTALAKMDGVDVWVWSGAHFDSYAECDRFIREHRKRAAVEFMAVYPDAEFIMLACDTPESFIEKDRVH